MAAHRARQVLHVGLEIAAGLRAALRLCGSGLRANLIRGCFLGLVGRGVGRISSRAQDVVIAGVGIDGPQQIVDGELGAAAFGRGSGGAGWGAGASSGCCWCLARGGRSWCDRRRCAPTTDRGKTTAKN